VSKRSTKAPIFIGVAWPYANGGLHLGHVAGSLLPPDIFRRFMRMTGHDVLMVSGSDCHGTPILLKAEAEGTTPQQIVEVYHADHVRALDRLGIGFDLFTRTTTDNHRKWVQRIFLAALDGGFIEKRTQDAPYDAQAGRFLPDRYVEGTCPHCGNAGARGDQCDSCGKTLDPQELRGAHSKLNPEQPIEFRATEHFFFLLSELQPALEEYVGANRDHWRPNTINFTQNWLREGLKDRAITRDLAWGVPIPLDGFEDKRIYVWFEAVCGYLTAAIEWARRSAADDWDGILAGAHHDGATRAEDADAWQRWWCDANTRAYYFLGKDNIPFHSIIWPAILTAFNEARAAAGEPLLVLPYDVAANEFLNLDGKQFSKSRGISIAVHDVLDRFDADAVRYYLAINMPEQRDADWKWDDFFAKVNDELVGTFGNLVHRILSFTAKNVGHVPMAATRAKEATRSELAKEAKRPKQRDSAMAAQHTGAQHTDDRHAALTQEVTAAITACGADMAAHLGRVELKKALRRLMEFAAWGNQKMQSEAPWQQFKSDRNAAEGTLHELMRMVHALAVFVAPFLPHAADRIWAALGADGSVHNAAWADAGLTLRAGAVLAMPEPLFRKLETDDVPGGVRMRGDKASQSPESGSESTVSFAEFQRVQLRLATVARVEPHPNADRLFVMHLDVGDLGSRQVVAGLRGYYDPDELVGQTVAFVANLEPVVLRGVESQGMILAADHDGVVAVLNPQRPLPAGARIR
jgi:methionyl-tRNA synthetase